MRAAVGTDVASLNDPTDVTSLTLNARSTDSASDLDPPQRQCG